LHESAHVEKTPTQIYEMIPEGCDLTIRSWLNGFDRQYACTLTATLDPKNRWTGFASKDLKVALAAATAAANRTPPSRLLWKGAMSAMPINTFFWTLIILAVTAL
jgi:hypothetical protein